MDEKMDFSKALVWLKAGRKMCREGWNGKGMFIQMMVWPDYEPCITMYTAQGLWQPGWLASQADLFATDWMHYEEASSEAA